MMVTVLIMVGKRMVMMVVIVMVMMMMVVIVVAEQTCCLPPDTSPPNPYIHIIDVIRVNVTIHIICNFISTNANISYISCNSSNVTSTLSLPHV